MASANRTEKIPFVVKFIRGPTLQRKDTLKKLKIMEIRVRAGQRFACAGTFKLLKGDTIGGLSLSGYYNSRDLVARQMHITGCPRRRLRRPSCRFCSWYFCIINRLSLSYIVLKMNRIFYLYATFIYNSVRLCALFFKMECLINHSQV